MAILNYSVSIERSATKSLEKLTGRDGFRIRVGNYRIIYDINDPELKILVIDIGHRKDIYR